MAASKKTYQDITDQDLNEYQEEQFHNHQDEMDQEQEWDDFIYNTNEWDRTVKQQENIVCELLDKAEEGSELEAYCTLKQIKKLLDEAIKQVEPEAITKCELESPNNSAFKKAGFEIQKRNGGKIIDFSNVPEVAEKETELKKFKEILKHALTGVEKGATMLSDGQMVLSDGELVNLPKWKYKKDSIVVKKL
jgi:hypothetical protein